MESGPVLGLKSLGMKRPGLKLGVEKFRVEMSCNHQKSRDARKVRENQLNLKVSCLEFSTWYIILVFVISMLSVLLAGNNSGNSSDFAICFFKRCQSVWQDRKTTNCAFRPKIRELQICCKQFVTLCAHRFQLACLLAQKLFRLADTYTGWTHVFGRFLIPTL